MVPFWICLAIVIPLVNCEIFTAVDDIEGVEHLEAQLLDGLKTYITGLREQLDSLKKQRDEFQQKHMEAMEDPSGYLANPINAYLLTKRLTTDWKKLEDEIRNDEISKNFNDLATTIRNDFYYPKYEDFVGVSIALDRLQEVYKMNASSVAKGELNGIDYGVNMTGSDCFELGRALFESDKPKSALYWFEEALKRTTVVAPTLYKDVSQFEIYEYIADCYDELNNPEEALKYTNKQLEIEPDNEKALDKKVVYEGKIEHEKIHGKEEKVADAEDKKSEKPKDPAFIEKNPFFEKLCTKEDGPSSKDLAPLRCRYEKTVSLFFQIAPIKMEEVSLDPKIVIYRDFLDHSEIEAIKNFARPLLQRSTTGYNSKASKAEVRSSKTAWIFPDEEPIVDKISNRIAAITGLSLHTSEALQVVNYGVGGHYKPHFDFHKKYGKHNNTFEHGNRIATFLIYLNDIEQGGATVFPEINSIVWPQKGSAVFWYNLHKSGVGDLRTRHTGCPVLVGSKWIANKWFHEEGQELLRPCELKRDDPQIISEYL